LVCQYSWQDRSRREWLTSFSPTVGALDESGNAATDAGKSTLRALQWRSATALPLLARTTAIACKLRLVAKRHFGVEPAK